MTNLKTFLIAAIVLNATALLAEDLPLKVEISVNKPAVKTYQFFNVSTLIRNTGTEDVIFKVWSCSLPRQWTADSVMIRIKEPACSRNELRPIKLKPGEVFARNLSVRAEAPIVKREQQLITFRLGFNPNPESKDESGSPIWSNELTLNVSG